MAETFHSPKRCNLVLIVGYGAVAQYHCGLSGVYAVFSTPVSIKYFEIFQITPEGGLEQGTTYAVRVAAYNGVGWSEVTSPFYNLCLKSFEIVRCDCDNLHLTAIRISRENIRLNYSFTKKSWNSKPATSRSRHH